MLVGREPDPPYERPPASKGYLAGTEDRDACLFHDAAWYASRSIELATRTSVMRLDTDARTATLSTKEVVEFGVALIATGANVRRLRVDGAQLEGIHYLRTLGNADAIRADALEAEHVVLVGGSYIACEVAATLTTLGRRCTMVMLEDAPLAAHFGATAGEFFGGLLREHGVELVCGDGLERLEGDDAGAARRLRLGPRARRRHGRDGHRRDARRDARPRGRARAGGDAAASPARPTSRRRRAASGPPATCASTTPCCTGAASGSSTSRSRAHRARRAAAAMLGTRRPYAEVPYFWTDLADWCTAEWVGTTEAPEQEIVRGSVADGAFSVLHLAGGRLVAALSIGRGEDLAHARRLIAAGTDLSGREAELAGADLDDL